MRSGWDHSYLPPKKCKEEGGFEKNENANTNTTDIFVYDSKEGEEPETTEWGEDPSANQDTSWYDQFEQLFFGSDVNQPQPQPPDISYMDEQIEESIPNPPEQELYTYQYEEYNPQSLNEQVVDVYNTEQCIHTYNVVNTVEEVNSLSITHQIHTPEDILINQAHLMCLAGEITEYEESYLQQLILAKDPSAKEALRRYSL